MANGVELFEIPAVETGKLERVLLFALWLAV